MRETRGTRPALHFLFCCSLLVCCCCRRCRLASRCLVCSEYTGTLCPERSVSLFCRSLSLEQEDEESPGAAAAAGQTKGFLAFLLLLFDSVGQSACCVSLSLVIRGATERFSGRKRATESGI